jgi:hypothetical protein
MARYRKIEVRTWADHKFRSLTPMQPSGQALWFFLLTGPHTSAIPGLFRAGRAALSEEIGWPLEAFDKAFGEVFAQGMAKADFSARLVWLPNAIKHNRPESPNVVKSWASEFDLLPECDLKDEAWHALKSAISELGEGFAKAFDEAFGKPSRKAYPKATPNQEQEQEQEQTNPQTPLPSELPEPAAPSVGQDDIDQIRMAVWRQSGLTEDQIATKLVSMSGEGIRQARTWLESHPLADILAAIAEAYDGAEARGEAIRKPWPYLSQVVAGIAERKAQEAAAPVRRDKWEDRRALIEAGAWPSSWGIVSDAPQWVREAHASAKAGKAA